MLPRRTTLTMLLVGIQNCTGFSVVGGSSRFTTMHRAPAVALSGGGDWMFVDVKGDGDEPSRQLEAIVDPFGRSLLVGDAQWYRVASPEALLALDVASRNGSLVVHIPTTSCSGSDGTIVQVTAVDTSTSSAYLVAIGRCLVEGIAGKTPRLRCRVRAKPDQPLEGSALARAREAAASIEALWERACELFVRIQGMELRAKLRSLGSSASSSLLSIPLEQQLELSQSASVDRPPPASRVAVEAGIDEALGAGVSLAEAVSDALRQQPEDGLALVPPTGDDASSAQPVDTWSSARLSLFSFVALRLTRRTVGDPDDFLEIQPDPRAPTIRQAQGVDALDRLELCQRRLEDKVAEMGAKASMLALFDSEPESEGE